MEYKANVAWQRNGKDFQVKTFDRAHQITFAGGQTVEGSSAPEFLGNAELANPEELFTASISSCFMLTFLYWAAMKGLQLESYTATAIGKLGKNADGKMAMTEVVLKPQVTLQTGQTADESLLEDLYKKAHDNCFISCSVNTKVTIEAEPVAVAG